MVVNPKGCLRREFLGQAGLSGALVTLGSCGPEVSPNAPPPTGSGPCAIEALAQDHGLMSRILSVYEESARRLDTGGGFKPLALVDAARVMREYIEDCHVRLEEVHLFPRYQHKDARMGLIEVLRNQHQAGRRLTSDILQLDELRLRDDAETRRKLARVLLKAVQMCRPHEAREDTELFPLLRDIVTRSEMESLREDFERERNGRLGSDGFDRYVGTISESEKALEIHDLARFTAE